MLKRKISVRKQPRQAIAQAYALPSQPSEIATEMHAYSYLIYGRKKIGKTSLAAEFANPIFLCSEPGTKAISVREVAVKSWEEALGYLEELEKAPADYCSTVVLDIIDYFYDFASDFICAEASREAGRTIAYPGDANDYGKTWARLKAEYRNYLMRLLRLGKGVVFISHDTEKEVENYEGEKIERMQPSMADRPLSIIEGLVDIIGYYFYAKSQRFLRISGSETVMAGCRCEQNFKGIKTVSMGSNPREGYGNLVAAFDDNQKDPDPAATFSRKKEAEDAQAKKLRRKNIKPGYHIDKSKALGR